jgi:hypothetical protein
MLALSGSGVVLAVMQPDRISSVAGLLAFYLVTTSLLTVRRHDQRFHWMDAAAALIGLTAAILGFTFGIYAVRSPTGMLDEQLGAPAFVFGGGTAFWSMLWFGHPRLRVPGILYAVSAPLFVWSGQVDLIPLQQALAGLLLTLAAVLIALRLPREVS